MNVTYNPLNDTYEAFYAFINDYMNDQNKINKIKLNSIPRYRPVSEITKIISNDDATIILFSDKTKIVVKRMPGDDDDIYAAVAQAICKKIYGGTSSFHKMVDQKLEDFRSPVFLKAEPVINSFTNFFNNLWNAAHSNDIRNNLHNTSEGDKE